MAYTREIEKLEVRWKENPKGTVFAPLAEVYRKDGQLERAREVLREGLENNPDHIPGNIVLGRCCLDLKEDSAAETAFVHVLQLDAENVIALKALADITERQGRLAEAEQWLRQLMAVDPSNDEARDQMARVEAARNQAAALLYPVPAFDTSAGAAGSEASSGVIEELAPAGASPRGASEEDAPGFRLGADDATYLVPAFRPDLDQPAPAASAPPAFEDSTPPEEAPDAHEPAPLPSFARGELPSDDAETVEIRPPRALLARESENSHAFEAPTTRDETSESPADTDLSTVADSHSAAAVPGSVSEFPEFDEDAPVPFGADEHGFDIGVEQAEDIVLRSSSSTEFQEPSDADQLLRPSGSSSEFQTPNDSEILSTGSHDSHEYQTPNDSESLLASSPERHEAPAAHTSSAADSHAESHDDSAHHQEFHEAEHPEPEASASTSAEAPSHSWSDAARHREPDDFDLAAESPDVAVRRAALSPEPAPTSERADEADLEAPATISAEAPASDPADLRYEDTDLEELAPWSEPQATPAADYHESSHDESGNPEVVSGPSLSSHEAAPADFSSEQDPFDDEDSGVPLAPAAGLPLIFPEEADALIETSSAEHRINGPKGYEPDLIVTETMAELYYRQGHIAEALQVYRILASRSPDDPRLRTRVAELEAGVRRPVSPPASAAAFSAASSGGQSVEAFFRSILNARLGTSDRSASSPADARHASSDTAGPNGEPYEHHGSPTRPAHDHLSLSAIFGEDASPVPPVMPAGESVPSGAPPQPPGGFSFDRFFGTAGSDTSPGSPSGGRPSKPSGIEEDLDQFQNWLKGLKR